jgi:hypothetical protein
VRKQPLVLPSYAAQGLDQAEPNEAMRGHVLAEAELV